jgi:hypothetical protein
MIRSSCVHVALQGRGRAEDLLNKLSGSELVQFQLFYNELVELTTVDEIGNLVEQYHSRGFFPPLTDRGDTFVAGSVQDLITSAQLVCILCQQ